MATEKHLPGPTPNGGVRAVVYFKDAKGDPCDELDAAAAEGIELDADGRTVGRTYLLLTPNTSTAPREAPRR